jgi:Na+/phosphate symporter
MKKDALAQLKQKHRSNWVDLVENRLAQFGKMPAITKSRIRAIYSLFNADDKTDELDVMEREKVVAKLVRTNNEISIAIKRWQGWVTVYGIPLHTVKFTGN